MSFSIGLAKFVAEQLSRFVTLSADQLAGQVENLDFWLGQVRNALATLDGYGVRFIRLQSAQEQYIARHQVTVTEIGPAGVTERPPRRVQRIPDRLVRQARRALVEVTIRFLNRCFAERLIAEAVVSAALAEFT